MDKTGIIIIVLILIAGAFFYFQSKGINSGVQSTSGELTRTVPSSVSPGQTFIVTYSSNKQGKYGVIIVDSVSGGCKFQSGKTEYKSVVLSENGPTSEIVQVTAPLSGSCTFSGDYNFANEPIIKFPDQTIQIK